MVLMDGWMGLPSPKQIELASHELGTKGQKSRLKHSYLSSIEARRASKTHRPWQNLEQHMQHMHNKIKRCLIDLYNPLRCDFYLYDMLQSSLIKTLVTAWTRATVPCLHVGFACTQYVLSTEIYGCIGLRLHSYVL